MYTITTVTPPVSEPVSTATLKAALRLNTSDEDTLLAGYITTARMQFEHLTQRAVFTQTLRQYVNRVAHSGGFPECNYGNYPQWFYYASVPTLYLMRGDVQSVSSVHYYDPAGSLQTSSTHTVDTVGNPRRVYWASGLPSISTTLPHPAYVDFVAGWTSVPADVCTAIQLLAAHYYEERSAFVTDNLKELPRGFAAIAARYDLGLNGNWGM